MDDLTPVAQCGVDRSPAGLTTSGKGRGEVGRGMSIALPATGAAWLVPGSIGASCAQTWEPGKDCPVRPRRVGGHLQSPTCPATGLTLSKSILGGAPANANYISSLASLAGCSSVSTKPTGRFGSITRSWKRSTQSRWLRPEYGAASSRGGGWRHTSARASHPTRRAVLNLWPGGWRGTAAKGRTNPAPKERPLRGDPQTDDDPIKSTQLFLGPSPRARSTPL